MTELQYQNQSDLRIMALKGSKSQITDRITNQALRIVWEWQYCMSRKQRENDMITSRLNDVQWTSIRQVNNNLPPYLLFIVKQKVRELLTPPDFKLLCDEVSEEEADLVTGLVVDVMDDAGWKETLSGKWGIFDKIITYGDAFVRTYTFETDRQQSEQDRKLFTYQNCQMARCFFNLTATEIRCMGSEGDANEAFLRFQMDYDEFMEIYPELYGKVDIGNLPTQEYWPWLTAKETPEQQMLISPRKVEWGYYYNKRKKIYCMIAGSNAYRPPEYSFEGDDYPFVFWDTEEPYIPLLHFTCFPKPTGLYSSGVCTLLYPLDMVWQELMNRGVAQILDNANPTRILNMPAGQRQLIYKKLEMADAMRANGGTPLVLNEMDVSIGGNAANNMMLGQLQTMNTPALTNEFERLLTQINLVCGYLGIKLDNLLAEPDTPLGTTQIETQSATKAGQRIVDINEKEFEFAVRIAMDAIARDVDDNDTTPLRTSIKVNKKNPVTGFPVINPLTGIAETERVKATHGAAAETLRAHRWRIEINTASGVVKNNVLEQSQLNALLADPTIDPSFRAQLQARRAKLMGINMPKPTGNPMMNAQNPQQGQQMAPQPGAQAPQISAGASGLPGAA